MPAPRPKRAPKPPGALRQGVPGGRRRADPATSAPRPPMTDAPRRDRTTDDARAAAANLKRKAKQYHDARRHLEVKRAAMLGAAYGAVRVDRTLTLDHAASILGIAKGTLHPALVKIAKARARVDGRK